MKKMIMMALVAIISMSAMAQDRPNREEMQARRAQAVEQQAERFAKDFDLKGDAKTNFVATYKAYQNELAEVQTQARQRQQGQGRDRNEQTDAKKLTNEQATQRLTEYFSRQEEQIAQQVKRLEIEKKYSAELAKNLTPQQLVTIFAQRNNNQRQGGQGQRQGGFGNGNRGGFGGPQGGGFGGPQGGGFGGDF